MHHLDQYLTETKTLTKKVHHLLKLVNKLQPMFSQQKDSCPISAKYPYIKKYSRPYLRTKAFSIPN